MANPGYAFGPIKYRPRSTKRRDPGIGPDPSVPETWVQGARLSWPRIAVESLSLYILWPCIDVEFLSLYILCIP